jgi:hypothetical protein
MVAATEFKGDGVDGAGVFTVAAESTAGNPLGNVGSPAQIVIERSAVFVLDRPAGGHHWPRHPWKNGGLRETCTAFAGTGRDGASDPRHAALDLRLHLSREAQTSADLSAVNADPASRRIGVDAMVPRRYACRWAR